MLGRAARTSLWHVVGVVIIFACLPRGLPPCPSGEPITQSVAHCSPASPWTSSSFIMSSCLVVGRGGKYESHLRQTELRHHRDYVTAAAGLRFIIVKRNGNLPDKWIDIAVLPLYTPLIPRPHGSISSESLRRCICPASCLPCSTQIELHQLAPLIYGHGKLTSDILLRP